MKRVLVSFCLLLLSEPVLAATPGTVICQDPAVPPARIMQWSPTHAVTEAAFDSTHLFLLDQFGGRIHRYALNGENHSTWSSGTTGIVNPGLVSISPTTGDVYVSEGANTFRNLFVFDPDGNGSPEITFFSGPSSIAPGGHIRGAELFAIHPETGEVYVLDEGWFIDGEDSTWVSRIQRYTASGAYNGLVINNALGVPPDEDPNPTQLVCGAWHNARWLMVDHNGNVYLSELVDYGGPRSAVHKFSSTGACLNVWDLTTLGVDADHFRADPDGYFYTFLGSALTKWTHGFGTILYERPMSAPVSGLEFSPASAEFFLAATFPGGGGSWVELFGPQVEPLDIIQEPWQQTAPPYQLDTTDLALLSSCDPSMKTMEGVVADGVSPLLVRWKLPGPGTVRWLLEDASGAGVDSLLGTLASLDSTEVDVLTIETDVLRENDGFYAFAIYTSPINFDRVGMAEDDENARSVYLQGYYQPLSTPNLYSGQVATAPLNVFRPPVMFVHGIWSNSKIWNSLVVSSVFSGRPWYRVDYSPTSLGLTKRLGAGTIRRGVNETRNTIPGEFVVKAQVDVIMHSLGGLHVRKFADAPSYKNAANMGMGDFHKLLFLDTPHEGAYLANNATRIRSVVEFPLNPAAVVTAIDKRVAAVLGMGSAMKALEAKWNEWTGEALDDMRTDSPSLAALNEVEVPTHAHVGDASSFWSILTPPAERGYYLSVAPTAVLAWINGEVFHFGRPVQSDLIVSTGSQQGGLASSHYETVFNLPYSIHTEVPQSPFAEDIASEWLHRRTDDSSFFAPSIPAPVLSGAPGSNVSTLEDDYARLPHYLGRTLTVTVNDVAPGESVSPGQNIHVGVTNQKRNASGGADTVFVFYPGGAIVNDIENVTNAIITIPPDFIGPFEIVAMAEGSRDFGNFQYSWIHGSPPVVLNVDPAVAALPATLVGIRAEPVNVSLLGRGSTENLRVYGQYSDGIERDISASAFGTYYAGLSQAVAKVNPDGTLVGVAQGSSAVSVSNGAFDVLVPVNVLDEPAINNAPHADAGEYYSACDSQVVYLDGTGSYDVDELIGDVLTYEWDLNADGEFDDAVGPTPYVQLLFPGLSWLIGLRVTDSGGLQSTDYAVVEAGPGCLEGDFVCSPTPRGAEEIIGIGVDGAGNIYRAEFGAQNQIVKYSAQCDSLLTIPLSGYLEIAIATDGTVYALDGQTVLRFQSDGTPLTSISLSHDTGGFFEIDSQGHFYTGSPTINQGIVQRFAANGSRIATWDAAQATGDPGPALVAVGPNEEIYVAATEAGASFNRTKLARGLLQGGTYVLDSAWSVGGKGVEPGQFDAIWDAAIDPDGDLYVCENGGNRIQKFDANGTFLRMWLGSNQAGGGFWSPRRIAVGAQEQLVVVDNPPLSGDRTQVMTTNGSYVGAELAAFTRVAESPSVLVPHPATPATGCPQGDDDELVITVALDPASVAGPVPKSAFGVTIPSSGDDAVLYATVEADSDAVLVNEKYRTSITLRQWGGCASGDLIVRLNGAGIGLVPVDLRSPDIDVVTYGVVVGADFAKFGVSYQSPPKPYDPCADYRPAFGQVNASDFSHFGTHYKHNTGDAALSSQPIVVSDAAIRLSIEASDPLLGARRLWASVSVENLEPFKALVLALRSDNTRLRFVAWHPDEEYPSTTMGTELVRDGQKQVFMGILGTGKAVPPITEIGKVEFEVLGEEPLSLTDDDLAFLIADLETVGGDTKTFSILRLEKEETAPTYRFELAQNFPNPFNPSTTIAYSLAKNADVSLVIFDVRGARVKTLVDRAEQAGIHRVAWDGTDNRGSRVSSGIYFYRLMAGSFSDTKRMVLLR